MAKAAEVASQMDKPARLAGIQSAFGTRTPDVVPFHVKTTSSFQSMLLRSGNDPKGAVRLRNLGSFNWVLASLYQPPPKDSQWHTVTPRGPRSCHIIISTAPVSLAGTIATR